MTTIDYNKDSKEVISRKWYQFDVKNMLGLKKVGLWCEEDESKFYSKYSESSEEVAQKIRDYFKRINNLDYGSFIKRKGIK